MESGRIRRAGSLLASDLFKKAAQSRFILAGQEYPANYLPPTYFPPLISQSPEPPNRKNSLSSSPANCRKELLMRAGNALRRHLPSLQNHTRHKNATPIPYASQPRQPGYIAEAVQKWRRGSGSRLPERHYPESETHFHGAKTAVKLLLPWQEPFPEQRKQRVPNRRNVRTASSCRPCGGGRPSAHRGHCGIPRGCL